MVQFRNAEDFVAYLRKGDTFWYLPSSAGAILQGPFRILELGSDETNGAPMVMYSSGRRELHDEEMGHHSAFVEDMIRRGKVFHFAAVRMGRSAGRSLAEYSE